MLPKIFYPANIENIWHKSADGQRTYRLDSVEKIVRLKDLLEQEDFKFVRIDKAQTSLWNLVHTPEYVSALLSGEPRSLAESSGIMWQKDFPQVYANSAKAMILACKEAISHTFAVTLGKGGHHTVSNHGYGFGPVNEVAIAIKFLQKQNPEMRIAVLDTDVHIGNGWQELLRDSPQVLLVDIWNKTIPKWKLPKPTKNIRTIYVEDASEYIMKLNNVLKDIKKFNPDLLIYHCGLDVLDSDRMGGIKGFSEGKLILREEIISNFVKSCHISTVFVTGGGYVDHVDPKKAEKDFKKLVELYKNIILMFSRKLSNV